MTQSEPYETRKLADRSLLLAYLETERLYAAYAIGDLEPGLFEQSTWAVALVGGQVRALALHFRGLALPALFLMGDPGGLRAILEKTLCPDAVYLTCRAVQLAVTRDFYAWEETIPMWRMALQAGHFCPVEGRCTLLLPAHVPSLLGLYAQGSENAFSPAQVEQGVFYGVFRDDRLVAVAGTHLVSPTYGVAAVGNVFTHPEYRGQGYATVATSAVVAELLRRGVRDVILNVRQENAAAVRVYERLGFERHCPFLEGPARVGGAGERRQFISFRQGKGDQDT